MRYDDGINTRTLIWAGVISVIVLVLSVIGLQAWYLRFERCESQRKMVEAGRSVQARATVEAQRAALNEYRWVDRDKGRIAIPIDLAIDMVVEQTKNQRVAR